MFKRKLASHGLVFSMRKSWYEFERALKDPVSSQNKILRKILNKNQNTLFGQKFQFSEIRDAKTFQDLVPLADYSSFESEIEQTSHGVKKVLTADLPVMFERTSGSTSKNKLIPFTKDFFHEVRAAIYPWLYQCYKNNSDLHGTEMYWSLSPITREKEFSTVGIPIGVSDDSEYFEPFTKFCLGQLIVIPRQEAFIRDHAFWKAETSKALVNSEDLGFISIWSPTFLIVLMEDIERNFEIYLSNLSTGRRNKIEFKLRHGVKLAEALWPKLKVVSCWTDAGSSHFIPRLMNWFSPAVIEPKGLLATEGVVSIPYGQKNGCPLAVTSHFLEFIDIEQSTNRPLLAHELIEGANYTPLLTTSSGLYRYHLKDIIQCTGYLSKVPLIRFKGKLEQTSDICGEKISVQQVEEAILQLETKLKFQATFKMLIPIQNNIRFYTLVLSGEDVEKINLQKAAEILDSSLGSNVHYSYARDLGQLAMAVVIFEPQALEKYQHTLIERGLRFGDIKTTVLDPNPIWQKVFFE